MGLFDKIKSLFNNDAENKQASSGHNVNQKFVDAMEGNEVKKILFKVKTDKVVTIKELMANELFECYQVAFKTASERQDDYKMSDIESALFGVRQQSTFGFEVDYQTEQQAYTIKIMDLATTSDWTGALMFIKMLSLLTNGEIVDDKGTTYTVETIVSFKYSDIFLTAVQQLVEKIKTQNSISVFRGIKYPVYIGPAMIRTLFEQGDLFEHYDKRLKLTQHIQGYHSEQQLFKLKDNQGDVMIAANYFALNALNILAYSPTLSPEHRAHIRPEQVKDWIVFVMEGQNKVAEVSYRALISALPENKWFFIDEVTIAVQPVQLDEIKHIIK